MATLIWILLVGGHAANPYDEDIKKAILRNDVDGMEVSNFSTEEEFGAALTTFYSSKSLKNLSILIDARCADAIEHLLTTLKKPMVAEIPKIVLLSTLLTWSGKKYTQPIEDYSAEFIKRVPLLDTMDIYATENSIYEFSRTCRNSAGKLYILSVGLLYGRTGYDFKDSFRAIFDSKGKQPISGDTSAKVPMVHIDQLLKVVEKLLQYTATLPSVIIPLVDSSYDNASATYCSSLSDVLGRVSKQLNGAPSELVADDNSSDDIDKVPSFRANLWNSDVWFGKSPPFLDDVSLLAGVETTWREYIGCNNLDPTKMMIAGTPTAGKTNVAKALCERLDLQYVDAQAAVKYSFNVKTETLTNPNISKEFVTLLKGQITAALDEKREQAKAKDKGKKGDVVEEPAAWDDSELTDDFCRSDAISPELLRGCVLCLLLCNSSCCRKGYVIDLWEMGTTRSGQRLCDAYRKLVNGDNIPCNEDIVQSLVELAVEIQVDSQVLLEKLSSTFPPKPSKEQAAALKSLEATLLDYSAALVPINKDVPETGMSHKGFFDLFESGNKLRIKGGGKTTNGISQTILDNIDKKKSAAVSKTADAAASNDTTPSASTSEPPSDDKVFTSAPTSSSSDASVGEKDQNKKDQEELLVKSKRFQNFLMSTVVPHLTSGLIRIARERPDDPIAFMSSYLQQQSEAIQQQSRADAIEKFHELLNQ